MSFDHHALTYVARHRTGLLTGIARGLADAAGHDVALAVFGFVVAALAIARRRIRSGLLVAAATAAAYIVAAVLKAMIRRPRPPYRLALVHPAGFSMPSTDAAITAAAATALVLVTRGRRARSTRLAAAAAALIVLLLGLALVYLGVHWPTDVVAGWGVGIATSALLIRLVGRLRLRYSRPPTHPWG